jgi:membrane dipeptidase
VATPVRSFTLNTMPFLIVDAHQDLAYNALSFGRDYRRAALDTRRSEEGQVVVLRNGHTQLGWPDYQRGQVAMIFGTLFLSPPRHAAEWETQAFRDATTCHALWRAQVEYYRRLAGDQPDMFRLVKTRADVLSVFKEWEKGPAVLEEKGRTTHPVGLTLLMEGAEGIGAPRELEEWWDAGVRLVGPVWAGDRFCGGMLNPGGSFTREGYELLEVMAGLGLTLDLSHMNERSALQALDRYEGPIVATHANARALLRQPDNERHFTDQTIRLLVERGGIQGVLPFGRFLRPGWSASDPPSQTTLDHLLAHIDHICQIAGDARHVAIGSDFDGGWGWPAAPLEIDTIADLQKLAPRLMERGYSEDDTAAILGGNWRGFLERTLPA